MEGGKRIIKYKQSFIKEIKLKTYVASNIDVVILPNRD